jgi:hypothetical protein
MTPWRDVLPDWVVKEIDAPVAEGEGRNNQMIRLAPRMLEHGLDPFELLTIFRGMYGILDYEKDNEIQKVINNALKYVRDEEGTPIDHGISREAYAEEKLRLENITRQAALDLPMILEKGPWPEELIRIHGNMKREQLGRPFFEELGLVEQRREFIRYLFYPHDILWAGDIYDSGKSHHAARFKSVSEWLQMPHIRGEFCSHCTFKPGTFSRLNANVVARRYMVVESDKLDTDSVGAVFQQLTRLGLTLRAVVHSGNRSLHGWFNWPGEDTIEDWKALLVGYQCDPSTTRASQPVRLPGCVRRKTGRSQELLWMA